MSMKYKREIHIKLDVPWLFHSESAVCFLPLFSSVFNDHNKECLGEIYSQH